MQLLEEPIKKINKYLDEKYGHYLDGQPWFRLVWAPSQLEVRRGVFTEMYGDIFLRESMETKEVKKYEYLGECYVLEKLISIDSGLENLRKELVTLKAFTYEPIWTFVDKDNNALPVHRKILDFIIHQLLYTEKEKLTSKNEARFIQERNEREAKEDYDRIDDAMQSKYFAWGDGLFLDSTKQKNWEKPANEVDNRIIPAV